MKHPYLGKGLMYTRLQLHVILSDSIPESFIKHIFGTEEHINYKGSWYGFVNKNSSYFAFPFRSRILKDEVGIRWLMIDTHLKYGDDIIEEFLGYLKKYVVPYPDEYCGYTMKEDDDKPTPIFWSKEENKFTYECPPL
jgi:hypothetical protein